MLRQEFCSNRTPLMSHHLGMSVMDLCSEDLTLLCNRLLWCQLTAALVAFVSPCRKLVGIVASVEQSDCTAAPLAPSSICVAPSRWPTWLGHRRWSKLEMRQPCIKQTSVEDEKGKRSESSFFFRQLLSSQNASGAGVRPLAEKADLQNTRTFWKSQGREHCSHGNTQL